MCIDLMSFCAVLLHLPCKIPKLSWNSPFIFIMYLQNWEGARENEPILGTDVRSGIIVHLLIGLSNPRCLRLDNINILNTDDEINTRCYCLSRRIQPLLLALTSLGANWIFYLYPCLVMRMLLRDTQLLTLFRSWFSNHAGSLHVPPGQHTAWYRPCPLIMFLIWD